MNAMATSEIPKLPPIARDIKLPFYKDQVVRDCEKAIGAHKVTNHKARLRLAHPKKQRNVPGSP